MVTGLEDVCAALINEGFSAIFNVGPDIVEHKPAFRIEIPVQANSEIPCLLIVLVLALVLETPYHIAPTLIIELR